LDGKTETPCAKGTYGDARGLTLATDCKACLQGYYCPEGTAGQPTNSLICPKGHYCPTSTGDYKNFPCPAGDYYNNLGAVLEAECVLCPAGRYCSGGTDDPFLDGYICPRGHYCEQGDSNAPVPCPAGKYTEEEGSTGLEFCKSCPAGHYCTSGTHTPTPCDPGFFNPMTEKQDVSGCSPCTSGKACTKYGLTEPDYPCSPGYYCPGGNYAPNQTAYACPAGTFTNYQNLTDVAQCDTCPETFACLIGTGGVQKPPVSCGKGHYCPSGTASQTQWPCPAGSYTNLTNLKMVEECYVCPRGWYCLEGSEAPTGLCFQGHWCPDGKLFSFFLNFYKSREKKIFSFTIALNSLFNISHYNDKKKVKF
jgi:hypothetical protein